MAFNAQLSGAAGTDRRIDYAVLTDLKAPTACGAGPRARLLGDHAAYAIAAAAALLYGVTLSRHHTGDGLILARAVETLSGADLLVPHRLLTQPLGQAFYRSWQAAGWTDNALIPLQAVSALGGGMCVGLVYAIGCRLAGRSPIAGTSAAGFGVSCGTWLYSTDAESITIPLALMLGVLWWLLRATPAAAMRPQHAIITGLGSGLAILTYFTSAFLLPAAAAAYLLTPRAPRWTRLRQVVITVGCMLLVTAPVYLALLYVVFGVRDWQGLAQWRLYGGAPGPGELLYGRLVPESVPHGIYGFLRALASYPGLELGTSTMYYLSRVSWPERLMLEGWYAVLLTIVALPLGMAAARWPTLRRSHARSLGVLSAWSFGYAAFATYWVPGDPQFWLPVLAAWWLLVGVVLSSADTPASTPHGARSARFHLPGPSLRAAAIALVGLLAIVNFAAFVLPNRDLAGNRPYAIAMSIKARTSENDLILTGGSDTLFLYVPYFADRRTISVFHILLGTPADRTGVVLDGINRDVAQVTGAGGRVLVAGAEPGRNDWPHLGGQVEATRAYFRGLKTAPAWDVAGESILEVIP